MALVVEFAKVWALVCFAIVALLGAIWIVAKPVKWAGHYIGKRFGADAEERWYNVVTVLGIGLLVTLLMAADVLCSRGYC